MYRFLRWFGLTSIVFSVGSFFSLTTPSTPGYSVEQASQTKLFAYSVKKTYARAEPVTLLLVLKNIGVSPVDLSLQLAGTVRVKSLKKDGATLPTQTSFVLAYEDLSYLLQKSLVTIRPNGSVPLLWVSEPDLDSNSQALTTTQLSQEQINQVTYYAVRAPGNYELTLVYEMPNLPSFASSVLRGATNEATLTFRVLP